MASTERHSPISAVIASTNATARRVKIGPPASVREKVARAQNGMSSNCQRERCDSSGGTENPRVSVVPSPLRSERVGG